MALYHSGCGCCSLVSNGSTQPSSLCSDSKHQQKEKSHVARALVPVSFSRSLSAPTPTSPRRRRAELVPPRYPSLPGRWRINDHPEVLLLAELHTNASVVGAMLTLTPGDAATCTMYVEFGELMLVTILRSTTNLAPFLKDTVIEG